MANNRRRTKPTSVNYSQFPSGYEEGLQKLAAERAKSRFTDFTQLSPRIDPVYDQIEFEYENQNINDNLEGSPAKPFFGIGGRTARVKGETNPRFVYFPELADDGTPQKDGKYRNTNMHIRIEDNAVYLPSIGAYVNKDSNGNTFVLGQDGTPKAPLRDIKMPIPTSEVAMFSKLKAGGIEDARPDLVKMPEQVDPNYDENFFLGNAKAIAGGAQHLYYTSKAFAGALTGDADMVMEATKGMSGVAQSQEQRRLQEDVQRRLGSQEYQESLGFWGGVYNGIKAWSAQVIENPNGLFDTILGMAPMGVAIGLTGGAAGAVAGAGAATVGLGATATAAAVGTAQVATMYGANTILTGGMKSVEAASDGSYNKQEGYDAIKKGAIKSIPYVGVDLLTMGITSKVLSMPARAMERAAFKILTKNGINPSEVEAGINSVRQSVLAKHANLENTPANRSIIQADLELNIGNYLRQSKLATPELIKATQEAMKLALNNSNKIMSKLPRAAIRYGSTSLLMGAGEYAGELAAEGHASPSMAVEVAFTGLGMTVAHVKLAERYARLKGKIQGIDTPKDAPLFNNELAARLYYQKPEPTASPTPETRSAGSEENPTAPTPPEPTANLDPNSITVTTDNSGIPVIRGLGNESFQESLNRANVLSFRILEQDRLARQILSEAEGKPMSYQQELMYNDHIKTRDYLTEQLKPINEMLIRNNPEPYKGDRLDGESTRAYVEEQKKLIDTRYAEIEKRKQDVLKGRDEVDPSLTPDELKQIERINVEEGFVNADSQALRQIHGEVMDSISQDPAPKVPRITPEERSLALMNLNRSFYGSGTVGNEGRPLVVRAATESEITQGVPNSKFVSAIGDALGINLVYTKGGKGVFEGVYSPDAKRVVFLDVDSNGKTPALNVLFHEFAHMLEKSPQSRRTYERIKSQIFEKDGDGNFIHIEKDAYDRFVEKTALIEQNARGIDREQALRIAEAEVVSEVLGSASNTEAFIKTLSAGDAKKFKGFIQEFVDYIKEVVTTVKERYGKTEGELMTKDLEVLAEKLAKIISEDGTGRTEGDGQTNNEIAFSRTKQEDNAKKDLTERLSKDHVLIIRKNPDAIPDSVLRSEEPMAINKPLPENADAFLRNKLEAAIEKSEITDPALIERMMNSDITKSDLIKRALMLPQRVGRYWYENSARAFKDILKLSYEDTQDFFRVLSGTSGGQKPYQNTKLALATMAQWLNNKPVEIGVRDATSLAKALDSDGLTSLKFGSFADTFLRLSGLSKIKEILATIDTQMAQMAGNESTEGPSAAQYEAISRYLLEVRDHLNKQMAEEQGIPVSELKEPLEVHQLQAMMWVEYRAQKEATGAVKTKEGKFDDYASVLPKIMQELKDNGIPLSEDGKITRETLGDELVKYVQEKSESTKGITVTTEINSESVDRLAGVSFVRKVLNLLPEEMRQRANEQLTQIYISNLNRLIKKTNGVSPISRLLTYVVGFDGIETTRAVLGQGTYEGKVSPNLRFPLSELLTKIPVFDESGNAIKKQDGKYQTRAVNTNEMLAFMSEIGKALQQESNAASMFADRGTLDRAVYEAAKVKFEDVAKITIDDAFTFYVKGGLEAMSPDVIASLNKKIGLPINYSQSAAGHMFDVIPAYWVEGKNNAENIKSAFKELGIDGTIIERDYVGYYIEGVNYDAAIKQQQAISRRNSKSAKEGSRQQNAFGRVGVYSRTVPPAKGATSETAKNYNKYIKPLTDLVDNQLTPELTKWSNRWNKEVEKVQKATPKPDTDLSYKRPEGTVDRIPELEDAIKQRKSGEMTQDQFNETVSRLAPVYMYPKAPEIAPYDRIREVVNSAQADKVGKPIGEDGKSIRTRVDIPSYVRSGTHVVAIHDAKSNTIVSYEPFIALDGPITFGIDKEASAKIGAGDKSKFPMAFIDGKYKSLTQQQIRSMAEDAMSKPDEWRQVGVDPRRHGFAYDRETQDPIVGADEVIQIGGLVLAKGVKYATPEQRKDIYYKRVEKPKFNPFMSAEDRETVIYNVSDSFVDIKRLVQAAKDQGQKFTYENDPDANLVQAPAKARFENNKFRERFAKSLFEATKKFGVTEKELSEFLHYDHATERNIQTQSIGRKSNRLEDGGSGLTEKEIRQYFNNLPENKRDALSKAAKEMRKFDEETLKLKYTYGLITDTDYANILQAYKKHVPLMRIQPDEMVRDLRAGKARTGTETTTQRAKGSALEVSDVVNNIMADREHAINLIHKNRINKSVWNFLNSEAKRGVDTRDFGVVIDPSNMTESDLIKMTTQLDKYGLTESEISSVLSSLESEAIDARDAVPFRRPSTALQAKNVLFVRDGNKFKYVVFNPQSEPAMRFAEQLKILTPADPSKFVNGMNKVTRVFTGWNTTLDPTFPVRNFILDSTGMVLNLSDTPLNNKVGAVYKNMPSVIKEIWSYSMDKAKRTKGKPLTEVQKFYEELMESGGTHHWNEVLETAEKRTKYLAEEIKALERGENLGILEFTKAVHEANQDASENAGRLSVYMEMRKLGYTKDESANVAKKISIDFDTSGAATRKANKVYAFLSASVGGQSRTLKAINSERGRKVVGGLVGLGVLQAFMLAATGLDDEIPEWEQRNNFIIPTGGKTYMKIKVRGLSSFLNIGRVSTQLAMGEVINKGEKISGMFSSFREMLDPFGQTGSLLQTLTPTILRPVVGAMENKNWTGEKLFNEKFTDEDVNPAYARAKRKTSAASVSLSEFLNNYSGGSPYSSGLIDIPPEIFDSLVSSYGGGYGRIASQVKRSAEEGRVTALPIIREVAGAGKPEQMNTTYFYDIVEKVNEVDKGLRGYAEDRDTRGLAMFKAKNPNYKLIEGFKEDIKEIRAIDKKAKMAKSDEEKNQLEKKSNKLKAKLVEKYRKKML